MFGATPPAGLVSTDYLLRRCSACTLVFADPMLAGSEQLYDWLTGFDRYHTGERWEWRAVRRLLEARDAPVRLLEIGCGDGGFLYSIRDLDHVQATGIDGSAASVDRARQRGIDARHQRIADLARERESFDFVLLSHVVEHVADPRGLIEELRALVPPEGTIAFSVPYSPLSREYPRWDAMNLPPHHLTRWNLRALETLAARTGMAMAHFMPKAKSPLKRALKQTWVVANGGEGHVPAGRKALLVLSHIATFCRIHAMHRGREKVDGRPAGDVILVCFTAPRARNEAG